MGVTVGVRLGAAEAVKVGAGAVAVITETAGGGREAVASSATVTLVGSRGCRVAAVSTRSGGRLGTAGPQAERSSGSHHSRTIPKFLKCKRSDK